MEVWKIHRNMKGDLGGSEIPKVDRLISEQDNLHTENRRQSR